MNFKPGDIVDLDAIKRREEKFEKRRAEKKERKKHERSPREILKLIQESMLHNISLISERLDSFDGSPENLITESGQINTESFSDVYSRHEIAHDGKITQEKKKAHYQTYEPSVQEKYNETDQNKLVEIIENETSEKMRDGSISEDLLFLINF